MTMPYALNGNAHIYYEVDGEGPPLILMHGYPQHLEDWREFGWAEALRQEYQLILISARGHGESEKSHDAKDYQMDVLAADVVAVLDQLRIDKAHFFGYSRGSLIGCAMIQHAPHRLWSVVLGGMNPYENPNLRDDARKRFGAGMAAYLEKDTSPGLIMTPEYKARRLANDPQALIAAAQKPSLVDILTNLKLPCLVYAGEAAGEYHILVEFIEKIPGARFFSLPGLGHGQGFRYSRHALPQIKQFLHEVTPRAEQNRAVVRRVVRAVNSANFAGLEQCYHPSWTWNGQANQQGAEGVRQLIGQIFNVFADAEAEIEEITADEDTVTTRWVFKGTHTGTWMGVVPSGVRVRASGATVDRIVDGKIVESRFRYDPADLQRQLGIASEKSI
jgi:pimeloyl-ACP methyl ester carboxylesterase/predicted ester cyclase